MSPRPQDFERLWDEHAMPLLSFLTYRTGDRVLAEDLLADTFERALRARLRFDPRRASEKTWLYTIALNRLRDHQRRSGAERRAVDKAGDRGADGIDAALAGVETRDEVQRGLSRLSDEEREAIALRFGADLTVPEIAGILSEKLSTVEGRVYRALRKLRDDLGPAEPAG